MTKDQLINYFVEDNKEPALEPPHEFNIEESFKKFTRSIQSSKCKGASSKETGKIREIN